MSNKHIHTFSPLQENMRALDAHLETKKWMNTKPQLCWKCQKDKQTKGGAMKFFGSVRRFICVDCVLTKQVAIARAVGNLP